MQRWKTSKYGIISVNYFHLTLESKADHRNNYQKYLFGAVLKNICSENCLQNIINASVTESMFS